MDFKDPCLKCGKENQSYRVKPKKNKEGFNREYVCKSCTKEHLYLWRENNPERVREIVNNSYLKSVGGVLSRMSPLQPLELKQAYRRQRKAETTYLWQKNNPEKMKISYLRDLASGNVSYRAAKRRAAKKKATPGWADLDSIKDVYQEAKYMQLHVDHIYPLQSDWVCGLHVWDNLQLLDPILNIKKGNRVALYEEIS